jgi:hypothetical protein
MVGLLSHLLALLAFCHHRPFVSFVSTVDLLSVGLLSVGLSPVDLSPPHPLMLENKYLKLPYMSNIQEC